MTHFLVLLLSLLAFTMLALAKKRHYKDIFRQPLKPEAARWLRMAGWSLLGLALWIVAGGEGWALGLVIYSGHTTLAAGLVYSALILYGRSRVG